MLCVIRPSNGVFDWVQLPEWHTSLLQTRLCWHPPGRTPSRMLTQATSVPKKRFRLMLKYAGGSRNTCKSMPRVTINLNVTSIVVVVAAHPTAAVVVVELMASLLRGIRSVRHDK